MIDTLDFLNEQANLMAFTGKVLGIVPFRDRWVGNTQTLEGRQNIEAMKEFVGDIPIFPLDPRVREIQERNSTRQTPF